MRVKFKGSQTQVTQLLKDRHVLKARILSPRQRALSTATRTLPWLSIEMGRNFRSKTKDLTVAN